MTTRHTDPASTLNAAHGLHKIITEAKRVGCLEIACKAKPEQFPPSDLDAANAHLAETVREYMGLYLAGQTAEFMAQVKAGLEKDVTAYC